jgi:hypothetical protein
MAKFLFIYRSPPMSMADVSPEQLQASLAKWGEWIGKYMQSGHIVDPGDGLQESGKVLSGKGVVTDGPYMESKEVLGGYSIINAKTYDEAVKIARECPNHLEGGSIEIRELAGFTEQK